MKIAVNKDGCVLDILKAEFGATSRTRIRKMIQHKMVRVGGILVTRADQTVKAGQTLEYARIHGRDRQGQAPVPILFEDRYLLVVEKPPGLLTFGERGAGGTSLYKKLLEYQRVRSSSRAGLYVVHRLDREVSGIVIFAKSTKVQEQLKVDWKKTRKYYYALVEGGPVENDGKIQSVLKEGLDRKVFSVKPPQTGRNAVTHYRVLERYQNVTLLEVRLETGRKNQIRVHLSDMGCPVVGDWRYGARDTVKRRIRLHAFRIGFSHPVSGAWLEFESPMPAGFLRLENREEKYK